MKTATADRTCTTCGGTGKVINKQGKAIVCAACRGGRKSGGIVTK